MALKIEPTLIDQIQEYGAVDASACFNCGNCTAVCSLAEEDNQFPRKIIRYLQLGLKDKVLASTEPWLCYYCGDCSATCPREADPGEIMMATRRYATAQYDITRLGAKYYKSTKALLTGIFIWFILPILWIGILHALGWASIVTTSVKLNSFAPVEIINLTAHAYGIFLGIIMIGGMYKMWRFIITPEVSKNVVLSDYVAEIKTIVFKGATISRWLGCTEDHRFRWLKHYILIISYASMFVMIVGFLHWFQTDEIYPIYNPQRLFGYIATLGLLFTTIDILIGRARKDADLHLNSTHSDWFFPASILVVAITGILVNIFRYAGLPMATYVTYAIHLGFVSVMLSTEVGVGKWAHIFYRPLALYFNAIKKRAADRAKAA